MGHVRLRGHFQTGGFDHNSDLTLAALFDGEGARDATVIQRAERAAIAVAPLGRILLGNRRARQYHCR